MFDFDAQPQAVNKQPTATTECYSNSLAFIGYKTFVRTFLIFRGGRVANGSSRGDRRLVTSKTISLRYNAYPLCNIVLCSDRASKSVLVWCALFVPCQNGRRLASPLVTRHSQRSQNPNPRTQKERTRSNGTFERLRQPTSQPAQPALYCIQLLDGRAGRRGGTHRPNTRTIY